MTDVSQRPIEDLIWALETWLTCTLLEPFERSLIEALLDHTRQGHIAYEKARQNICSGPYFAVIFAAIHKARMQGLLREWR